MENSDSLAKQQAVDGKGAFAGSPEPNPELDVIDTLTAKAGVSAAAGEAVDIKATLDERDENRWELSPESADR